MAGPPGKPKIINEENQFGFDYDQYGRATFMVWENGVWTPRLALFVTSKDGTIGDPRVFSEAFRSNLNEIMKNPKGFKELRTLLIKHYGLSESSNRRDAEFMNAYKNALYDLSVRNMEEYLSGTQKYLSLMSYLRNKKTDPSSSGGDAYTGPTSSIYLTGKQAAKDTFRNIVNQLTGKAPNKEDFEEFYDDLIKKQKRYINRKKGKYNETITQNPFDLENFALRYVVQKLDISGDMSGQVGVLQDIVDQASKDYGLFNIVGSSTKIKLIKGLLTGKLQEKDIDDTLRDLAKVTYTAFSDDIDKNPNISFKDIISPYIQTYNQLLEKTGIDTDISKVLNMAAKDGKKLSLGDFEQMLIRTEDYQGTTAAKRNASNLAMSFARAFGVNI